MIFKNSTLIISIFRGKQKARGSQVSCPSLLVYSVADMVRQLRFKLRKLDSRGETLSFHTLPPQGYWRQNNLVMLFPCLKPYMATRKLASPRPVGHTILQATPLTFKQLFLLLSQTALPVLSFIIQDAPAFLASFTGQPFTFLSTICFLFFRLSSSGLLTGPCRTQFSLVVQAEQLLI